MNKITPQEKEKFIKELEKLSRKHNIWIKSTTGGRYDSMLELCRDRKYTYSIEESLYYYGDFTLEIINE